MNEWLADHGDETRRLDYPLPHEAVVFDAGAHHGKFAMAIRDLHHCRVFAFEPVPDFFHICAARVGWKGVRVFNVGLAAACADRSIWVNADASSVVIEQRGRPQVMAQFWTVGRAMRECKVERVDLLKLNVEGAEFEILESLLESGLVNVIGNLQVQFHFPVPDGESRYARLRSGLARTHEEQWSYGPLWQSWRHRQWQSGSWV